MRFYSIGLIPLFLGTTAHAQIVDLAQPGWDLRRGEASVVSEPLRLRPSSEPALLSQTVANQTLPAVAPVNPAYSGYSLFGGTLALGTGFGTYVDDNVFASSTTRRSDTVVVARPEFSWQSFGKGYAVGIDGFLEAKAYNQFSSENQVNGSIGSSFKMTPTADSQLLGSARYARGHLERGTSETVAANGALLGTLFEAPIEYEQTTASMIFNKRFEQWWMSVGGNGTVMKFDNPSIAGVASVDLGYANGNSETANLRVGHVIAPRTSVFAEVVGNTRNFNVNAFDSNGYRAVVGALFEPGQGSRIRGEIWGGFMNQDYKGASFRTVSTYTYGGALNFGLTDQLSMGVEGRRDAKEAALSVGLLGPGMVGVSDTICAVASAACVSAVQSTIGGRLDYKILPNLGVGGGVTYIVDQYLGTAAGGRVDHTLSPFASLKFAATNRVSFGLDYRRVEFEPTGGASAGISAPTYVRNIYLVSMAGKF